MSLLKVITRIIPLNCPSADLINIDVMTDGFGTVKVSELTDRNGVRYRIERIQCFQSLECNPTLDSVNEGIAAMFENVPDLVELKETQQDLGLLRSHKEHFQLSFPKSLSFNEVPVSSVNVVNQTIDNSLLNSAVISLVEPCSHSKSWNDAYTYDSTVSESGNKSVYEDLDEFQHSMHSKESIMCHKQENSTQKNKLSLYWKLKSPKQTVKSKGFKKNAKRHFEASQKLKKDAQLEKKYKDVKLKSCMPMQATDIEKTCSIYDSSAPSCPSGNVSDAKKDKEIRDNQPHFIKNVKERSFKDMLQGLVPYFKDGECLICGFISEDANFNKCLHMAIHIDSTSYKCTCCKDIFPNPKVLYRHTLSRIKPVKYECSICFLTFKRKYVFTQHMNKRHPEEADDFGNSTEKK